MSSEKPLNESPQVSNSTTMINHIGVSGGKDSTALLLWAVYESGYPKESLNVSFCDTGWEAKETYDQITLLSERVHSINILKPELDFFDLARKKKGFPSATRRFCTHNLKMIPTQQHIIELSQSGRTVLAHSGVRADESGERAQLSETEFDVYLGCDVFRPLLRWSIEDVWAIHERYEIPRNPLYDRGARRVGCELCIFSNKADIRRVAKQRPEVIARIREAEIENNAETGFSSFFSYDKTPKTYRSRIVTTKSGKTVNVPTIDDVARWSNTKHGGKVPLDDVEEAETVVCDSQHGFCE